MYCCKQTCMYLISVCITVLMRNCVIIMVKCLVIGVEPIISVCTAVDKLDSTHDQHNTSRSSMQECVLTRVPLLLSY